LPQLLSCRWWPCHYKELPYGGWGIQPLRRCPKWLQKQWYLWWRPKSGTLYRTIGSGLSSHSLRFTVNLPLGSSISGVCTPRCSVGSFCCCFWSPEGRCWDCRGRFWRVVVLVASRRMIIINIQTYPNINIQIWSNMA
jgi:hypothetical protein